jgi:tRNA nucleotidyltransferase (CCA-adding enzyme)
MMGVAFAEQFVPFIRSRGVRSGNVHVIRKNPDQSKHLETASAPILNMDIDFVNLRSEEYSGDSRIPSNIVSFTATDFKHCFICSG